MARDFDGATDRIDWANIYDPAGAAITVSFWVFPDTLGAGNVDFLFSHVTAADGDTIRSVTGPVAAGTLQFARKGTTDQFRRTNADAIVTGSWQHVLMHHDGGDTAANIHIFVDGTEQGYAATQNGASQFSSDGTWSVGAKKVSDAQNFDGRIMEFAWWDRELGAGERAMLVAAFSPKFIMRGLRFYVPMVRDNHNDLITGTAGPLEGTTVIAQNRMISPAAPHIITAPAAVVTGNPWHVYAQQ